jgi:hypothetical protein
MGPNTDKKAKNPITPAFLPNTDPSIQRATHSSIYLNKINGFVA